MARGASTEEYINLLRKWQALERKGIETTAEIMEDTDNLLVRQMMEIIRNDSTQHHRVQQFLIDALTKEYIPIRTEDLAEIHGRIREHNEMEKKTVELAAELKEKTKDPIQQTILEYLITDEEKHVKLLEQLDIIKKYLAGATT